MKKPMKQLALAALFIGAYTAAMAQAPQKMSYQAVIRNPSNALVTNHAVGMDIAILQGSKTGPSVYEETQVPTTNINGLVTIQIGAGSVVSGNFSTIAWGSGPYFVRTETDPTGGNSYSVFDTTQFLSVPYALYADSAKAILGGNNDSTSMGGYNTLNTIAGRTKTITPDTLTGAQQLATQGYGARNYWNLMDSVGGAGAYPFLLTISDTLPNRLATQWFVKNGYWNLTDTVNGAGSNPYLLTKSDMKPVHDSAWTRWGNAGTNPATNYIGTSDNNDVVFERNGARAGLLNSTTESWGVGALNPANTGANNDAFGMNALNANTSGQRNAAFGNVALSVNTTGSFNTAIGSQALAANTVGSQNTAVGQGAEFANTTGLKNVAVGGNALQANTTGSQNTGVGQGALFQNTVSNNTAVGFQAMENNTTGINNTCLGSGAMQSNTTSGNNTAVGFNALFANSGGINNVAIGSNALAASTSGFVNVAVGTGAMQSNTSGNSNVAVGAGALQTNTTANNNSALGYQAMLSNTTGGDNTAVGYQALKSNTGGAFIVAVGQGALAANTTGNWGVAVGQNALTANTTGNQNVGIGNGALFANITGNASVAVGQNALGVSNASANTAVGSNALSSNITGTNNTAIGYGAGPNASNYSNTTAVGNGATTTTSNQIMLGNTSVTVVNSYGTFTQLSDERFKNNIQSEAHGLDFIMQLKPVTYNLNVQKLDDFLGVKYDAAQSAEKEKITYSGFLAQEVEKAAKTIGYNFSGVIAPQNDKDHYKLAYGDFVVPLVKAVQEQQQEIDELKKQNAQLMEMVQKLEKNQ